MDVSERNSSISLLGAMIKWEEEKKGGSADGVDLKGLNYDRETHEVAFA